VTAPLKIGVVGAGGIAQAYAALFAESTTATCVGVADVRIDAARAMAERLGAAWFVSADELAALAALDAVVLCTPPATHVALAELFADRGVHVLSEKPLALNRHGAAEMALVAERTGIVVTMATKFRFCDDVNRAALIIASGRVGVLRLVEVAFTSRVDMSGRWNVEPSVSGGGVIIDNGTHAVDLVRHLLGPVSEVLAVETSRPADFVVEDSARLNLRTEGSVDAHVDLSWSIDKSLADFVRVYGTLGEIRVGWRESAWRAYGSDWETIGDGYAKGPAMGGALDAFCRAIRLEAPLPVTVDDGIAAALCVDAAYESLRRGTWVKLAELEA
jgi:predicted dehydrogenase